jgi:hypothetical protein
MDYRQFYNLEDYLLNTVRLRFEKQGYLSAEDFFSIVIWKANRDKSRVASNLQSEGKNLDEAVRELTSNLKCKSSSKEKLRYLLDKPWNLGLPMASAILTILYPEEFTVYDERVCNELKKFHRLKYYKFEKLWCGYQEYKYQVEKSSPEGFTLRDKDRYLWGKSFYKQLKDDIKKGFKKEKKQ